MRSKWSMLKQNGLENHSKGEELGPNQGIFPVPGYLSVWISQLLWTSDHCVLPVLSLFKKECLVWLSLHCFTFVL